MKRVWVHVVTGKAGLMEELDQISADGFTVFEILNRGSTDMYDILRLQGCDGVDQRGRSLGS